MTEEEKEEQEEEPFFNLNFRLFIVVGFSPVVGHYCFCSEEEKEEEEENICSIPTFGVDGHSLLFFFL